MKLERMEDFFAARLDGYDEHMKTEIEGAGEFYAYTASLLPRDARARILDLGCGTGLELEEYFPLNPTACVTGIDLSRAMLNELKKKFPDKELTLLEASYFDVPFGDTGYDAAVSVESLHHFSPEMKASLYRKLQSALKRGACFVMTDYFAESDEKEQEYARILCTLKREQGIGEDVLCHYDTPLTVEHEMQILRAAGFSEVKTMRRWENTRTLLAKA